LNELVGCTSGDGYSWDPGYVKELEDRICYIVTYDQFQGLVVGKTGTNTSIVNNTSIRQLVHVNERDSSVETVVLEACLTGVVVYDNPLVDEPKRFQATFQPSAYKRSFSVGPALIEDIVAYLLESGLVIANRLVKDALPALFNAYIQSGEAVVKSGVEYPGFYRKGDGSIDLVKYELEEVSVDDLRSSLILLEKLGDSFSGQKTKLAHTLKWGLIAPFSFILKQNGCWLILYGKAGSGKTTIADIVLYLWGSPESGVNDLGGSSFNTEARMGEKLRGSTFPVVVNEPGGVFEKPALVELLKTAIESTTSRGRFEGRSYKSLLALAPVIFTSNLTPPCDDALLRRLECISFSYAERKSEDEKEKFRPDFRGDDKNGCCFHALKPLAQFVVCEIVKDPSLLDMDWRQLTNMLVKRVYKNVDLVMPVWLSGWSVTESLVDNDELLVERVRVFLQKEINRAYNQSKSSNLHILEDVDRRILHVLSGHLIPWMFSSRNDKVYLTSGFLDALKQYSGMDDSLKSLAEMLGWEYKRTSVRGGFNGWCIVIDLIRFTDFCFHSTP
jgi:hypothetical protein